MKHLTIAEYNDLQAARRQRDAVLALVNSPEIEQFLRGVHVEAVHQVERWAPMDAEQSFNANGLAWAVSCWQAEVSQRPLVNVHRRTLDDTWRQVIRYFGGDPAKLIGADHDTLHMQAQEDRAWKPPTSGVEGRKP